MDRRAPDERSARRRCGAILQLFVSRESDGVRVILKNGASSSQTFQISGYSRGGRGSGPQRCSQPLRLVDHKRVWPRGGHPGAFDKVMCRRGCSTPRASASRRTCSGIGVDPGLVIFVNTDDTTRISLSHSRMLGTSRRIGRLRQPATESRRRVSSPAPRIERSRTGRTVRRPDEKGQGTAAAKQLPAAKRRRQHAAVVPRVTATGAP